MDPIKSGCNCDMNPPTTVAWHDYHSYVKSKKNSCRTKCWLSRNWLTFRLVVIRGTHQKRPWNCMIQYTPVWPWVGILQSLDPGIYYYLQSSNIHVVFCKQFTPLVHHAERQEAKWVYVWIYHGHTIRWPWVCKLEEPEILQWRPCWHHPMDAS